MNNNSSPFDYVKNHHEAPLLPDDNSRHKWIKNFISRCIAHFTSAQNTFNNNVAAAIRDLNDNLHSLAEKQNTLYKKIDDSFNALDNRQNDIVKSLETLTKDNIFFKQKQEEIEKFVQSTFSDIDNRQNSLIENIESANREMKNLDKRQNDIIKNVSEQIKNIDNRQNDIVKSFETLSNTNKFLKQKQKEIEKFVQSTFSNVDNRQNSLVENLGIMNDKISMLFGHAEKIKDLHSLYEQIAKQNKDVKNIISEFVNSTDKNSASNIKNKLKNIVDDSLYVDYEKAFRGSENIIRERLSYYIDKLKNVKTTAGKYILDVGCGRGEFVSLLIENKFHAKGIDTNSVAVQHAVKNKLPVKKGDLFNVLEKCKDNSLPVISAFHVIEHLRYNDLLWFFRIAKKKLQPNGKLLLETPNMLSLFVAACDFYKDPTHIRPLHPATLQFHLREIGFSKVEIDFLHPFPESEQLKILRNSTASNNNFIKLNNLIFGARDCAIIAKK